MATKKRKSQKVFVPVPEVPEEKPEKISEPEEKISEPVSIPAPQPKEKKKTPQPKKKVEQKKFPLGSIVYIARDAESDLNGFKLFPPYKKYTYTVEAYDTSKKVYSLRRLNLILRLKESDLVSPSERALDSLNRRQF